MAGSYEPDYDYTPGVDISIASGLSLEAMDPGQYSDSTGTPQELNARWNWHADNPFNDPPTTKTLQATFSATAGAQRADATSFGEASASTRSYVILGAGGFDAKSKTLLSIDAVATRDKSFDENGGGTQNYTLVGPQVSGDIITAHATTSAYNAVSAQADHDLEGVPPIKATVGQSQTRVTGGIGLF